jgi:acyl carrier protein
MATTITKQQIQQRVTEALVTFGADEAAITPDATFEELDVDSLDLVELGQIVESDFGVEIAGDDVPGLKTVSDVVELVAARA